VGPDAGPDKKIGKSVHTVGPFDGWSVRVNRVLQCVTSNENSMQLFIVMRTEGTIRRAAGAEHSTHCANEFGFRRSVSVDT
jgi:hypothetical protein